MIGDPDLDRAVDVAPLGVMEKFFTDQGNPRHEPKRGDEGAELERALNAVAISRPIRVLPEKLVDLVFG
jgi:hypothetical protein